MCQQITCSTCGKATWTGCGQHVDEALAGVPAAQRCQGHEPARGGSILSGLFRR